MLKEARSPDLAKLTSLIPQDSILQPLLKEPNDAHKKEMSAEWVVGHQKVEVLTYSNTFPLLFDPK